VISLPFRLLGQTWIWTWVLTNLISAASRLVPAPTRFHCAFEVLMPTCLEEKSPTRSSCPLTPGGFPPLSLRNAPWWWQGRSEITISAILAKSPQEMFWESQAKIWDTEAVKQEVTFYCAHRDPADSCPKAEPREQRDLTLCTLASRLQKQKAKLNPNMAACEFTGNFISPMLCDFFMFQFF
jgi:hypothetical protein